MAPPRSSTATGHRSTSPQGRPGRVATWDFTQAVRFWTDGKHANHGFMLHGDAGDYMVAHSREAAEARNRPAVLVVYVPK